MQRHHLLLAGALLLALAPSALAAGKYAVNRTFESTLAVAHVQNGTNCTYPGICYPTNVTVPSFTFWYWCGFYSTHRSNYYVRSVSNSSNFTGQWLYRKDVIQSCVIPNLKTFETCPVLPESACSKARTCSVRTFGLVFEDEICLVIVNNRSSNMVATIQYNNSFDSPRYYGTVFTILFCVVGFSLVLLRLGYDFYTGCKEPVSKHHEPVRIARANGKGADGLHEELLDRDEADGDEKSAATGGHWGRRIVNLIRCNKDAPAPIDPAHQA
ncbi:hypothetical protein HXX76_005435 [Chlamydomonas incerta]|uniref:Uncharacterized protein n=1 Tax=Chlamydomonas incerta TaxID=51695 RepID=A0A835W3D4_CHLIN|nr:hypothetical protein HXX76_005435 [Chlamydomonas incerta]|eukprot:KAG2437815.1 hypothetical protein HXX76_005435 [Chlamydomonas incerta]